MIDKWAELVEELGPTYRWVQVIFHNIDATAAGELFILNSSISNHPVLISVLHLNVSHIGLDKTLMTPQGWICQTIRAIREATSDCM